jgi:hypothetical protein
MLKRQAVISPTSEQGPRSKLNRSQGVFKTPPSSTPLKTPLTTPSTSTTVKPTDTPIFKPRYERSPSEDSSSSSQVTSMQVSPEKTELIQNAPLKSLELGHIELEISKKDNLAFEGTFPRDILKKIWTDSGRDLAEVKHLSCHKSTGRSLQVFYFLSKPLSILDVTKTLYAEAEVKIGNKTHCLSLRFPQFRHVTCELGKLTSVTFHKIPPGIEFQDLRNWLAVFGEVKGSFRSEFTSLYPLTLFYYPHVFLRPQIVFSHIISHF